MADKKKRKQNSASDWKNYMESKQKKQRGQFSSSTSNDKTEKSETSTIFAGISIFVNGYTDPSANELKQLMSQHGGIYNFYYNSKQTTHIIVSNLPNSKIRNLKDQKVVRPEWITDSIAAKRLKPCKPYELYAKNSKSQLTLKTVDEDDEEDFAPNKKVVSLRQRSPRKKLSDASERVSTRMSTRQTKTKVFSVNLLLSEKSTKRDGNEEDDEEEEAEEEEDNEEKQEILEKNEPESKRKVIPEAKAAQSSIVSDVAESEGIENKSKPGSVADNSGDDDCKMSTFDASERVSTRTSTRLPMQRRKRRAKKKDDYEDDETEEEEEEEVEKVEKEEVEKEEKEEVEKEEKEEEEEEEEVIKPKRNVKVPEKASAAIHRVTRSRDARIVVVNRPKNCYFEDDIEDDKNDPNFEASSTGSMDEDEYDKIISELTNASVEKSISNVQANKDNRSNAKSVTGTKPVTDERAVIEKTSGALKAGEPNFLTEFYGHSRLHYISAMKIEFRQYVSELQQTSDGRFAGRQKLLEWIEAESLDDEERQPHLEDSKMIFHIDMDCFFVSVGLRKFPQYRGKPVAVTNAPMEKNRSASSDRDSVSKPSMSEIACCNYEAREKGLHNGMFLGEALKLCPELVTIPYEFQEYKEVAKKLYNVVSTYTIAIEAVSCDELLADCTSILKSTPQATPEQLANCIRNDVEMLTACTCSIGIAHNCLLARMATRKAKPNGCFFIPFTDALDFLNDESVRDLPGVGRSIESRLNEMGVHVCAELQDIPLATLKSKFGLKLGQTLYNFCRGIDDREIQVSRLQQSVSAEVNYGIRFTKQEEAKAFLGDLAQEVSERLKRSGRKGKMITLKLKVRKPDAPVETAKYLGHGLCDNVARTVTLTNVMDDATVILHECCQLLSSIDVPAGDLRGVGIQISKLNNEDLSQLASANNLKNFLQKKSTTKKTVPPTQIFNDEPVSKEHDVSALSSSEKVDAQTFLSKDMTNLEIKELLNEWVSSHNDPASEDIEIIAEFLTSFIDDCDLERLHYILGMVARIFSNTCESSWVEAKEKIDDCVQKKMMKVYGGILKCY